MNTYTSFLGSQIPNQGPSSLCQADAGGAIYNSDEYTGESIAGNESIVSGNIGSLMNSLDPTCHVVDMDGTNMHTIRSSCIKDGFCITQGYSIDNKDANSLDADIFVNGSIDDQSKRSELNSCMLNGVEAQCRNFTCHVGFVSDCRFCLNRHQNVGILQVMSDLYQSRPPKCRKFTSICRICTNELV